MFSTLFVMSLVKVVKHRGLTSVIRRRSDRRKFQDSSRRQSFVVFLAVTRRNRALRFYGSVT